MEVLYNGIVRASAFMFMNRRRPLKGPFYLGRCHSKFSGDKRLNRTSALSFSQAALDRGNWLRKKKYNN